MIYSFSGNEVTKAYNCNGTAVENAYDIQGNQVYTDIDVTDVVSFYKQDVRDAVTYLRNLGEDYISYAIVTDEHYSENGDNYGYAPNILKSLYKNGVIDKIWTLGDGADYGRKVLLEMWRDTHADILPYTFALQGNHEAYVALNDFTLEEIYAWLKTNVWDVMAQPTEFGGVDHSYFYYDNSEYKIRFIFLDPNRDSTSQKDWLYQTAQSVPEDWIYFVVAHEGAFAYHVDGYKDYSFYRDQILFGNFEKDFKNDTKLGCVICGHKHCDILQENSGIKQVCFLCDSCKNAGGTETMGITLPSRNRNNNTAQAVTILSINPTLRKIKLYRIGQVMNNPSITWNNKQFEFEF